MSDWGINDVLNAIKELEESGKANPSHRKELWRRALNEGPTQRLIDDIKYFQRYGDAPKEILINKIKPSTTLPADREKKRKECN